MSCSKQFLGVNWEHHKWERHVTRAASFEEQVSDMWGRSFEVGHVICHTQYVCSDCGEVIDGCECTCEIERGERCPIRLEFLASQGGSTVAEAAAVEARIDPLGAGAPSQPVGPSR